jgi:hypothetical protein
MVGTECKIGFAAATSEVHGANIVAVFKEKPGTPQDIGALGISLKSVQEDDNPVCTLWLTGPVEIQEVTIFQKDALPLLIWPVGSAQER